MSQSTPESRVDETETPAVDSEYTAADITVLDGTSRVNEIARMLGGDPESKVSRAHAKELLSSATA